MTETMIKTDYRLYKTARGGKNGFVDLNDPAALEQLRNQYENTDISISICSYSIPDISAGRDYPLYVIIKNHLIGKTRNSAIEACYHINEYFEVDTENINIIYNNGGNNITTNNKSNVANSVMDDATAAEIILSIPPVVFDGHPTSLIQRINYQLVRKMTNDGIENIDVDVYQKDYMVNLSNSFNSLTNNYNIPLQLKELIHMSEEQIFKLAKKSRYEDSYIMLKKISEAADRFKQLYTQAEKEYKKQQKLLELMLKNGWQIPPCIRSLLWVNSGQKVGLEACRIMAQFYSFIKASENEIWHHIETWAHRNAYKNYQKLKGIIAFASENPQFAGCEDKLLQHFCPAGKCFMAELINRYEKPSLFENKHCSGFERI